MSDDMNPTNRPPQTTRREWLSPRETIAQAIEVVCSDGNSDRYRAADEVITALRRQGYAIQGRGGADNWGSLS